MGFGGVGLAVIGGLLTYDISKALLPSSILASITRPLLITLIPSLSLFYSFLLRLPLSFTLTLSRDFFPSPFAMNLIEIYAVAAGGTFSLFALVHFLPLVSPFFTRASILVLKHLTYPSPSSTPDPWTIDLGRRCYAAGLPRS
ncbi:hypothetical protein F5884DRAFT_531684 [Xylogone sp. PMI_703]|nr:hypothetical protein F5884DRAFT_531684 [Xylogone sp. PMI_703]